jgi:prevent-host-death family protein
MDVGVRELKAKLSAMLERAAAGEVITVTDRGRPVATLGPPLGSVDLAAAVEAGWVTPPSSSGLAPVRRRPAAAPVLEVLAEDRGE